MAAGRPPNPKNFDEAQLASMIEPLKLRIERITGGRKTFVPPPPNLAGDQQGAQWTKEEIRDLESFMVTHWTGGGYFEVSITDSSDPPATMKWNPFWDTREYPPRTPPPLEGVRSPDAPAETPHLAPITPSPGYRMAYPSAPQYPMPPAPPIGTTGFERWREEADRREEKLRTERLTDELAKRDREAREERHQRELERERQQNNERFSKLESALGGLSGSIASSIANALKEFAGPKGPSSSELEMQRQILEMREATRRAEEKAEGERREREADRREQALRDQMRTMQETAQRQLEAIQRQIEQQQQQHQQMITQLTQQLNAASSKNDPLLMFMQEQSRQHAETLKTLAERNQNQMTHLAGYMMNPKEMIELAREGQKGAEEATERVTKFMDRVIDTQTKVFEQALSLQPQGNGVIDVVRDGINGVKDFMQRYVKTKAQAEQFALEANARVAESQAQAITAQARAQNPEAFAAPPAPQLAGIPPQAAPQAEAPKPTHEPERMWGLTDREWFGPGLADVQELRAGVKVFHDACERLSASGRSPDQITDIPGIHPEEAAKGIVIAAGMAAQTGLPVKAITEFLDKGHLAEFMQVLLPEASTQYREDVIALLKQGTQDDEDEESDEGDTEEAPAPEPVKPSRNGRSRARA